MIKSDYWKIMSFIQERCELETLRWFEAVGLYYALFAGDFDPYIAAFSYFDEDEEDVL